MGTFSLQRSHFLRNLYCICYAMHYYRIVPDAGRIVAKMLRRKRYDFVKSIRDIRVQLDLNQR